MKKYEFTGETMEFEGRTLRRIRYFRNTAFLSKGDIAGWIESEDNLSHEGECCVSGNAKVFGHARIMDDAMVSDEAVVKDNVQLKGQSYVYHHAIVGADTILENTLVGGDSKIFFYADENYGEPNMVSSVISGETTIEARGSVALSEIHGSQLSGFLKLEDDFVSETTIEGD